MLQVLAPAGAFLFSGIAGAGIWTAIRQQKLLQMCQSRPASQSLPARLGEPVHREAFAGVWEGSYGFRTRATLTLNTDGTFRAEIAALNLLGTRAVADAIATGHWLGRSGAVLFSVGRGAPGLLFASGTLQVSQGPGDLRMQTPAGPLQLRRVHRSRPLRRLGDCHEATALG